MSDEKKSRIDSGKDEEGSPLCPECGSRMVLEEGELICPNCDAEIDFFGEEK